MSSSQRFVVRDVYVSEDAERVCLGNNQMELRFSKRSGSWVELIDEVTDVKVLGYGEAPTVLITVGGKAVRVNTWPYNVMVDTATLGSDSKYLWHSLEVVNDEVKLTICSELEKWRLYASYTIKPKDTLIKRSLGITYLGSDTALLSSVDFIVPKVGIGNPKDCFFEAPGLPIKPHYPFTRLPANRRWTFGATPHVNPGLLAVHNPQTGLVLMCWGYCDIEPFLLYVERDGERITLIQRLLVADRFRNGHAINCGSQFIRILRDGWRNALESFPKWYEIIGLTVPKDIPQWARNAKLYELHVGRKFFSGEGVYCPFGNFKAVIERLPYIKELGFNVIQLMPQFPCPNYSVEDYYAIDRTYGPEKDIQKLVNTAHSLGMKVILDLVIHGCVDKSIIEIWRSSTQAGSHQWIERFAQWVKESPTLKQHPEWFMRTETGEIAMTYTFSFDHANEDWQRYMIEVMKFYVQKLDIDGFRVDAPNWNAFPNWDPNIPHRASSHFGGAVRMLEKARKELKAIKPDLILYLEATGPLYHKVADFTYNYDEQWLYAGLLRVFSERGLAKTAPRPLDNQPITAKEMAEWFEERKLAFPVGSLKAHHVDSHDTHEWDGLGQFRREAFGIQASRVLFALCAFAEGPLMNYVGGEDESTDFYKNVLRVCDGVPELRHGDCHYTAVKGTDDMVFTVLRSFEGNYAIPVINFNSIATLFELIIPIESMGISPQSRYLVYDTLNDKILRGPTGRNYFYGKELGKLKMEMEPYAAAVFLIRKVLT